MPVITDTAFIHRDAIFIQVRRFAIQDSIAPIRQDGHDTVRQGTKGRSVGFVGEGSNKYPKSYNLE